MAAASDLADPTTPDETGTSTPASPVADEETALQSLRGMPWPQASKIIQYFESGGQNAMNYLYDPSKPEQNTSSGPWQLQRRNWQSYGRQLGLPVDQHYYAMNAPTWMQEHVAQQMYGQLGFQPWAGVDPKTQQPWNPKLRYFLLNVARGRQPQPTQGPPLAANLQSAPSATAAPAAPAEAGLTSTPDDQVQKALAASTGTPPEAGVPPPEALAPAPAATSAAPSPAVPSAAGAGAAPPSGGVPALPPGYQFSNLGQDPLLAQINALAAKMPQMPTPSRGQRIAAAIAGGMGGIHPAAWYGGRPVGFAFDPNAMQQTQQQILYGPYNMQMNQWGQQMQQLEKLEDLQIKGISARGLAEERQMNTLSAKLKYLAPDALVDPQMEQFLHAIGMDSILRYDDAGRPHYTGTSAEQLVEIEKRKFERLSQMPGIKGTPMEYYFQEKAIRPQDSPSVMGAFGKMGAEIVYYDKTNPGLVWDSKGAPMSGDDPRFALAKAYNKAIAISDPRTVQTSSGLSYLTHDEKGQPIASPLTDPTGARVAGTQGITPEEKDLIGLAIMFNSDMTGVSALLRGQTMATRNAVVTLAGKIARGEYPIPPSMADFVSRNATMDAMRSGIKDYVNQAARAEQAYGMFKQTMQRLKDSFDKGYQFSVPLIQRMLNFVTREGGIDTGRMPAWLSAADVNLYTAVRDYARMAAQQTGGHLTDTSTAKAESIINLDMSRGGFAGSWNTMMADAATIYNEIRGSVDTMQKGMDYLQQKGVGQATLPPTYPPDEPVQAPGPSPQPQANQPPAQPQANQAPPAAPSRQPGPVAPAADAAARANRIYDRNKPNAGPQVTPPAQPAQEITPELRTAATRYLNDALRRKQITGFTKEDVDFVAQKMLEGRQ